MGPIQNPLIQSLLTCLHQALSLGFSFSLWKRQLKNNLKCDYIILQKPFCTKLSTLGTSGEAEHLGYFSGCCMKAEDIPPAVMPPPFSSPCQPSHPLNISSWNALQCITHSLWPNTFLALLYDTEPLSSSSETFSDCSLPNFYFFGLVGWERAFCCFYYYCYFFIIIVYSEMLSATRTWITAGLPFQCLP